MNTELSKKMINLYYSTDKALRVCFNVTLEGHHINHSSLKLTIKPDFPDFGVEPRYINKILKEMFVILERIINQYKFNYQIVFSAKVDKPD